MESKEIVKRLEEILELKNIKAKNHQIYGLILQIEEYPIAKVQKEKTKEA